MLFSVCQRLRSDQVPADAFKSLHIAVNHSSLSAVKAMQLQAASSEADNVSCGAACHIGLSILCSEHNSRPSTSACAGIDFHLEMHQFILILTACKGHESVQFHGKIRILCQSPVACSRILPIILVFITKDLA